MDKEIFKYEPHNCEYTFDGDILLTKHADETEWEEIDRSHCIAEGINHHEVYKHFGKEGDYIQELWAELQWIINDKTYVAVSENGEKINDFNIKYNGFEYLLYDVINEEVNK